MRDAADRYLSTRDVKALRRHLKTELPLCIADAAYRERAGLLAITEKRVVWLSKGALRTRIIEVPRAKGASMRHRKQIHDHWIDIAIPGGGVKAFYLLKRGDEERVLGALGIRTTQTKEEPVAPPADHKARLDALLESGQMSKPEYEWALQSFQE